MLQTFLQKEAKPFQKQLDTLTCRPHGGKNSRGNAPARDLTTPI